MKSVINPVELHYNRENLYETIVAALREQGVDVEHLTRKDLAPVDEFHIRGVEATMELEEFAEIKPGSFILDVGCGIGGACRLFAKKYGGRVAGLDLTREFIRTARLLSYDLGLDNIDFVAGNALDMPFENETFDVAWTQHVQMNIEDKRRFYSEIARVLKTGGKFIYYDIFSRDKKPVHFPVPWAEAQESSFLIELPELHRLLESVGFSLVMKMDSTRKGLDWLQIALERVQKEGPAPVGLHLLMGESAKTKLSNVVRNLAEERIVLESAVWEMK